MALLDATSLSGLVLLVYLLSFVLFAILRITTGISIQRLGYFSLRRIAYSPKEGIRLEIRTLGLSLHRPTFVQPTWISLRLEGLKLSLNLSALKDKEAHIHPRNSITKASSHLGHLQPRRQRSQLWRRLTDLKERIKRLHRKLHWLRLMDVVAVDTIFDVVDVGNLQIGQISLAVDARRKTVDRGRLFRHKKDLSGDQRPAEWIFTTKSVLLAVAGSEPGEILDAMSINIHGLLYKDREGLRDTSIAVKLGRLHVPCDDLFTISRRARATSSVKQPAVRSPLEEISFADVVEELDKPGSREESIVQTVADSKEFISSILRGVQEIQMALSFIRISREIKSSPQLRGPVVLNVVTHEIGIDLHRLDQGSPAHRMYFSRRDVAHQALIAAISISLSIDDAGRSASKVLYIPMATTTVKTTLPSKTVTFAEEQDANDRNANILFANLVITSPSVDLDPGRLSQLLALSHSESQTPAPGREDNHRLISRLLPKASIKLSIHEPVVRFVLPIDSAEATDSDNYDLIISAVSSISLDVESSHSTVGEIHYSLNSMFRLSSHQLYYQTSSGLRHDLVVAEVFELKMQLTATNEVRMTVSGNLRSFSVHMVREEVSAGIYNIVKHFQKALQPDQYRVRPGTDRLNLLRRLPQWLIELHLEGSDFSLEIAGMDKEISRQTRGLAFQLRSWTAEYHSRRAPNERRSSNVRRRTSRVSRTDEALISAPTSHSKKPSQSQSDGRRLAVHVKELEAFIIESSEIWESDPFMRLPRFEVAFSTSSDLQGPIFHINSAIHAVHVYFSLYHYYSISVAGMTLQDAFHGPFTVIRQQQNHSEMSTKECVVERRSNSTIELVTVDFKISLIQIEAKMPSDPSMLFQVYDVVAGRHRWSAPFLRAQLLRLHAESPHSKRVWARLISMNTLRADMRQSRKKSGSTFTTERSIDLGTDFVRLAVPHGLTMYKVFDNFVNTVKSIEQLHHRFKTRDNDYVLEKRPEGPKHVPKISFRSKALMFEIEDDAFEWKLGTIYRVGQIEQKQRMARAEAFNVKVRRLEEERQHGDLSRHRARPHQAQSQEVRRSEESVRSRSRDSTRRLRSSSRGRKWHGNVPMRYNPDGVCSLTGAAKVQEQEARDKLQEHNARSWKRRIDSVLTLQNNTVRSIRQMFSGADEPPYGAEEEHTILAIPNRPGLMSTVISDLHLVIDKPSFPLSDCAKFLHEIGKGMPMDMQYSLLIPMNVSLDMGEARVTLRDYPLNLLHVPAIRPGQPPKLPSWSLHTDFVIAEEFRNVQSTRNVQVDIVPLGQNDDEGHETSGFLLNIRRTVSPVKTYSKVRIDINTSSPTAISWGTSYQPVIQDMMMIIEGFTKPEIDASDRVGFWDKIRLSFHSRLTVNWTGDGDVHLRLKGSRDPYVVTGYGAGFVMCWRDNIQWAIHTTDDPKGFMTVRSGEYVLAIPDYSHQARRSAEEAKDEDGVSTNSSQKNSATFKKVIMKLSGNVQWQAGLVFERSPEEDSRSFDFVPHYNVVLKNPRYLDEQSLADYDAFRGFRSHHIHLSIAVAAPHNREWSFTNLNASSSYNTVHLSPRFFTHFFDWWSLFSGIMSLPIRQGHLWRGPEKTSKKFGRHLATIKYNLLLSPLFIAHVYKHKDADDYAEDVVSATGLKLRLDSFMLDLHQRREWFDTVVKRKSKQTRTSGMRINEGQLDFINADLRAVSANIGGTNADDLLKASDEALSTHQQPVPNVDLSRFTIPDLDMSWIDMDDFVELDWILPSESNPETNILPLAFTPRFTYFRQTDHGGAIHGDGARTSQFGDEPTHYCVMSQDNDPRRVQMELIRRRIDSITQQIESHTRLMGEQELRVVRDGHDDASLKQHYELLAQQSGELQAKHDFLVASLARLTDHTPSAEDSEPQSSTREDQSANAFTYSSAKAKAHDALDYLFPSLQEEFASNFNNRFMIHNIQLKWNNSLRNIILRYGHQVSQRRGFVYYMSRRAVKFILDIVDEQSKSKGHPKPETERPDHSKPPAVGSQNGNLEEEDVKERIDQLLKDVKRFVDAEKPTPATNPTEPRTSTTESEKQLADDFVPQNSYYVQLIAPQIQLQSEKNTKAVAIVSAKGMQLKVVSIMDKARLSDDVSGLVQRQFSLDMDGAQFFVTTQNRLYKFLHLYSGNQYGNSPESSWPPWVSLEVMFDFELNPFGFERVIQKTSAALRYEKYNTLRLKYNEEVASAEGTSAVRADRAESRIDHLSVDFPRIRARCDSAQYYALYVIVLDLLLYSEPREKVRSERLEKIMLASDFSDLRGAPEVATSLQERIRQLEDIKNHFQVNAKYLDRQGWQDRIGLEKDLASYEDELFFIMKAITTSQSQRKNDDRQSTQSKGLLRWYLTASEVVWHLMRDKNEPLLEFQLRNAAYERIDNSDGSNNNAMEIERIHGLNLLSNALYPEMIGPYQDPNPKGSSQRDDHKMIQVHWYMLEAIAGIPVLEQFQVTLFPLKVQLERDLGKKLFEYIFPGLHSNAFESGSFSPFMVKNVQQVDERDGSEAEEVTDALSQDISRLHSFQDSSSVMSETATLSQRMKPTLGLYFDESPPSATHKPKGLGISSEHHHFNLFRHANSSSASKLGSNGGLLRKASVESLPRSVRVSTDRSSTNLSAMNNDESRRRFGLARASSKDRKEKGKNDELSQMISRASNYMTLAHVKLDSVVICLSYKGKGDRNFEDLHDFVFRMPILEYRNKTWSNLDLALRLKKDFIRAIISHTGAIIGNKFHHRPSRQQQSRLREAATPSQALPNHDSHANTSSNSDTGSLASHTPRRVRSVSPSRRSFSPGNNRRSSPLLRTDSFPSSIRSSRASSLIMSMKSPPEQVRAQTFNGGGGPNNLIHNALTRHFSRGGSDSTRSRRQQSREEDDGDDDGSDQESTKRKAVLLLGRKFLGSVG